MIQIFEIKEGKKIEKKTERINVRLTKEQSKLLKKEAEKQHRTISNYLVVAMLEKLEKDEEKN